MTAIERNTCRLADTPTLDCATTLADRLRVTAPAATTPDITVKDEARCSVRLRVAETEDDPCITTDLLRRTLALAESDDVAETLEDRLTDAAGFGAAATAELEDTVADLRTRRRPITETSDTALTEADRE